MNVHLILPMNLQQQTTAQTCDVCPGKNGKIAVFVCIKDYTKHVATKSHKERVLAHKVEHRRRGVLDKLDEDLATKPKAITMEVSQNLKICVLIRIYFKIISIISLCLSNDMKYSHVKKLCD